MGVTLLNFQFAPIKENNSCSSSAKSAPIGRNYSKKRGCAQYFHEKGAQLEKSLVHRPKKLFDTPKLPSNADKLGANQTILMIAPIQNRRALFYNILV